MRKAVCWVLSLSALLLCSQSKAQISYPPYPPLVASNFPGADACAKIAAAIAALPATGGTVDARGLEGTQSCAATVNVGIASQPVTLLLGAATITGGASANPMFNVAAGSFIFEYGTTLSPYPGNARIEGGNLFVYNGTETQHGTSSVLQFAPSLYVSPLIDGNGNQIVYFNTAIKVSDAITALASTSGSTNCPQVSPCTEVTVTSSESLASGTAIIIAGNTNATPTINEHWTVTVIDTTHFTIPTALPTIGSGSYGTVYTLHPNEFQWNNDATTENWLVGTGQDGGFGFSHSSSTNPDVALELNLTSNTVWRSITGYGWDFQDTSLGGNGNRHFFLQPGNSTASNAYGFDNIEFGSGADNPQTGIGRVAAQTLGDIPGDLFQLTTTGALGGLLQGQVKGDANQRMELNNYHLCFGPGSTALDVCLERSTTQELDITAGGKFGVGTTSPQAMLDVAGQARVKPVAFSTLTACSSTIEGETAAVTDSTTNTWGAAIAGGGLDHVLGYCDGASWKVAAP